MFGQAIHGLPISPFFIILENTNSFVTLQYIPMLHTNGSSFQTRMLTHRLILLKKGVFYKNKKIFLWKIHEPKRKFWTNLIELRNGQKRLDSGLRILIVPRTPSLHRG